MADYTDKKVPHLIINNMSQEKFNELKAAGELDPTQVYLTPTEETGGGASLPDQTDNAGKFLMTDGENASWRNAVENKATTAGLNITTLGGAENTQDRGGNSIVIGSNIFGGERNDYGSIRIGKNINTKKSLYGSGVYIASNGISYTGGGIIINGYSSSILGNNSEKTGGILINGHGNCKIGDNAGAYSICINSTGFNSSIILNADYSTFINSGYSANATITEANTFWWGNNNGFYKIVDADGTIPTDRFTTTPTDAGTYVLKLTIAEDGTATREWGTESGGAGGDSLPDLLNKATNESSIKIINAKNSDVESDLSGGDKVVLGYKAAGTGLSSVVAIGAYSSASGDCSIAVGKTAKAKADFSVAIGPWAYAEARRAIQLGKGDNSDANTFKVSNDNGNFEIMDANGNVPRERLKNLVEVLPTADNGYTTVKNFGNNYIEATGIYEVGSVEANAELVDVIAFPEGVQFEEGQLYWASAHATTEDSNANAVVAHITSRGPTGLTIVYKNLGTTEVENLLICWEVRGVVAQK